MDNASDDAPVVKQRSRRIKWILISLLVVVLLIGGYYCWKSYKEYRRTWRGWIETVFPADTDHDGNDDTLLILNTPRGKRVPMKAVDLTTGEILWKNWAELSHTYSRPNLTAIVHLKDVFVLSRYWQGEPTSLMAYDVKTGELRWSLRLGTENFCLFGCLMSHRDTLMAMVRKNGNCNLVAVDSSSGRKLWSVDLGRYANRPFFSGRRAFISGLEGVIIDLESKETIKKGRIDVFPSGDGVITVEHNRPPQEAVLQWDPKSPQPKPLTPGKSGTGDDNSVDYKLLAKAGDRLAGFSRDFETQSLNVVPLREDLSGFQYLLEDGFYIRHVYFYEINATDPEHSSFYLIEGRFVPFYFRRRVDWDFEDINFMIFDFEKGKPSWQCEMLRQPDSFRRVNHILRYKTDYLIWFPTGPDRRSEKPVLLVADGGTGSFRGAVEILVGDENALDHFNIHIKPEHLREGRLYFFHRDAAFSLDLASLKLAFTTSDEVRVVDAREKVERILGPLP